MKAASKKITNHKSGDLARESELNGLSDYHLRRASSVIQADLARMLQPFELRVVMFLTLALIVENAGLRRSHLADALEIERPNMVVIIDELETRDLISREQVPHDRHAYALHPTKAGVALFATAMDAIKAHEARIFAVFSDKELESLDTMLKKISSEKRHKLVRESDDVLSKA